MWMTREVVTISPRASVTEAAALMARKRVRRLPVTETHGAQSYLLGMVSASDILHAFPPDVNPFAVETPDARQAPQSVGEIMQRETETTTPATPIEEAAAVMRDKKIGALPVLHEGRLVGLITESDIFRAIVSLFSLPGKGARITFDMSRDEDVFSFIGQLARKHGVRVVSLLSAEQDNRPECVVRVAGDKVDRFLDDLWASGHLVLNVLRFPIEPETLPGS
jgi:CBS domain-containing protein